MKYVMSITNKKIVQKEVKAHYIYRSTTPPSLALFQNSHFQIEDYTSRKTKVCQNYVTRFHVLQNSQNKSKTIRTTH